MKIYCCGARKYRTSAAARIQPTVVKRSVTLALAVLTLCLSGLLVLANAQEVSISVRIPADSVARAVIEGNCKPQTQWSFTDSFGGMVGLGNRIENFELANQNGELIPTRKLAPGQFSASSPAARFKYEVKLAPPIFSADTAKISWASADSGLLMLRDLLPLFEANEKGRPTRVTLRMSVPVGWTIQTGETRSGADAFAVDDADRAVFAIGNRLRVSAKTVAGSKLNVIIQGEWAFNDADAVDLAAKVFSAHHDVIGAAPAKQTTLILLSYPQQVRADSWSAETRGATVTLLMGKLPSKVGALAQLSTPLTHELFHLWIPNGLSLTANYDWFYEGFTVYQAARTAVRLDLLTFPEFLNALARAYDGYLNSTDRDRWSLVEASERRWTTGQSAVYAKSMLVAFLYDLRLRSDSRGRRSLDEVYRKVFQAYRLPESGGPVAMADGNKALIGVLAADSAMQNFVERFVEKPTAINLAQELSPYGLTVETFGLRTRIAVSEQLGKQQRDLLRQLGYNDAAREPRRGHKN